MTAYTTLYFRMDIFDVRIMTALTALLVMATLFSQVSESLPKTSNFKMIDVWLLFCIMASFVIIIFHALIDYVYTEGGLYTPELGNKTPQGVKQVSPLSKAWISGVRIVDDKGGKDRHPNGVVGAGMAKLSRRFGIFRIKLVQMSERRMVMLARILVTGGILLFNALYWGLIYTLRVPME
ncbi:uncharacterized protein LOC143033978 [Oratosquilla oratoria]|uniref:uncharacterized protein LOC143033978 n=1 Tax=Oratosquilla oratoria TaxID=337810 RepID=UPI003F75FDEE